MKRHSAGRVAPNKNPRRCVYDHEEAGRAEGLERFLVAKGEERRESAASRSLFRSKQLVFYDTCLTQAVPSEFRLSNRKEG
ncbi:unnamed protein product [Litomosoides sigmodontis]|uniref:Uncharacterized protein n=1 Tax=Litomosoides sigmodontis TaxID=42156 RepID=A0A3P6TNK7_LITSI|nr:unnamed protein product [Litomosoides sigmodontis]